MCAVLDIKILQKWRATWALAQSSAASVCFANISLLSRLLNGWRFKWNRGHSVRHVVVAVSIWKRCCCTLASLHSNLQLRNAGMPRERTAATDAFRKVPTALCNTDTTMMGRTHSSDTRCQRHLPTQTAALHGMSELFCRKRSNGWHYNVLARCASTLSRRQHDVHTCAALQPIDFVPCARSAHLRVPSAV
jgi:hypothetical protein